MRKILGVIFFLLAVATGIGVVLAWEILGEYYVVLYSLELPWFTLRAVFVILAIFFAFQSLQMLRSKKESADVMPSR